MNEILGILVSRATVKMFLPCQSKLIISKLCIRGSFSTLLLVLWQKESISAIRRFVFSETAWSIAF
jgi:hypothetical protein